MEPDQAPRPGHGAGGGVVPAAGGIVLAAGDSTRMGRPKPLLRADGRTFLERAITVLLEGGCAEVVAVLSADGAAEEEARSAGARLVLNRATRSQQIDSLRLGLASLAPESAAAVVLPVDHPLVRTATVAALIGHWRATADSGATSPVIRPVHDGRPGHPTLFPRSMWTALMAPLPQGARTVVEEGRHPTDDVPVADPGILADIDTPEAFARWVEGIP